jgi:hypothetical protein
MKTRAKLLRELVNAFPRVYGIKAYTHSTPCRAYVHLKDVSKPSLIQHGASFSEDKGTGELTVKDALGEVLGSFKLSAVVGRWLDREPFDLTTKISPENVDLLIAELSKCGMVPMDGSEELPPHPDEGGSIPTSHTIKRG